MDEFMIGEGLGDLPGPLGDLRGRFPFGEVPTHLDILPESNREVLVIGDVEGSREFNHHQGDNSFGFQGTCGLVSCEEVLRQFGIDATEDDIVRHALMSGLCAVADDPAQCGGTTEASQAAILSNAGIPAHAESLGTLSDLTRWVQEGRGIIIEVNAGELWNNADAYDYGQANHTIVVTGVAVDPRSGEVLGYYVNDSGRAYPGDAGRFIPAELMQRMWSNTGGNAVITDVTRAG
jgi:hypothetical protein